MVVGAQCIGWGSLLAIKKFRMNTGNVTEVNFLDGIRCRLELGSEAASMILNCR